MSAIKMYSIVIELENASAVSVAAIEQTLRVLAEQIAEQSQKTRCHKPEVWCVYPGREEDSAPLLEEIFRRSPRLAEEANVQCIGLPEGRYYELKNAGIERSTGEVVLLLDSDVLPEAGWLSTLLAPFEDPGTLAAAGHSYLGYGCLVSRTLALTWIFPLREQDTRQANRRPIYSNNCAFRGDWIRSNPYPEDEGFKVACSRHARILHESEGKVVRVAAYGRHAALSGFRFLLWRALVTGRDADRKMVAFKGTYRVRRVTHALKFTLKAQARVFRRLLWHRRHVEMPLWQLPAAVALGSLFYSLAFCGQMSRVFGLAPSGAEQIPDYAEAH